MEAGESLALPFPEFVSGSSFCREERYLHRDRSYGNWHRARSIARFLPERSAKALTMLDLDSVLFAEYSHGARLPLALIEVAVDVGQEKVADITQKLAELAGIPAFIALYRLSTTANPANPAFADVDTFRIKRLWPSPEAGWRVLTPKQWADALVRIRKWQLKRFEARDAANDQVF